MSSWSPTSWQNFSYQQAATYDDKKLLNQVVNELSELPPLISPGEITKLKQSIALAGQGKAFILQGGDCAESFQDCRASIITNKLKILLQMSLILIYGLRKPIVRIGRIAGQYAKPRSSDFETIDGVALPSYRGDIVNSSAFNPEARTPNPTLLFQAYNCSAITLNFIRALLDGGFADLHHPTQWDLDFLNLSPQADEYHALVRGIADSLDFLSTIDGLQSTNLNKVDFYTSHEALHLHYEQALTRAINTHQWINTTTHLPWLGMRTAKINSAHVEFLRGIENPIGIKLGAATDLVELKKILTILNPNHEPGRLLLITRLGSQEVSQYLPGLIKAVQQTKIPVTWSCDPMHGNTETTNLGIKTRHFDNILSELLQTVNIHRQLDSVLGGVHFELTGENVTECIGGARGLNEQDLSRAYQSLVDPRLNYEQSLEIAIQLSSTKF